MSTIRTTPITALSYSLSFGMPVARPDLKAKLRSLGYSQSAAAKALGVTFETLNRVLNGHRDSRRLLDAIATLPPRKHRAA